MNCVFQDENEADAEEDEAEEEKPKTKYETVYQYWNHNVKLSMEIFY